MVEQRFSAGGEQEGVHILRCLDGRAIDDRRAARAAHAREQGRAMLLVARHLLYGVAQIRAVHPRVHEPHRRAFEMPADVLDHVAGRRGRERENRRLPQPPK